MSPVSCPLSPDLGLFLHASAVVVEGGAVLFLGHSTAGKSTIARLLGGTFPVLADDSVYAGRGPEGGWQVVDGTFRFEAGHPAEWSHTLRRRIMQGAGVPLKGCLRLYQAEAIRTQPLEPVDLARHLMDAVMEIDVQRKAGRSSRAQGGPGPDVLAARLQRQQWFAWVADIARTCPGGCLWFSNRSPAAELCAAVAAWGVGRPER